MARPKQFDPTEALERAMGVFWRNGFEGTSVSDLVEGMGINRASLYATFGDKHQLFVKALDHYAQSVGRELIALLEAEGAPREVLTHAMQQVVAWHTQAGEQPGGCFMTNAAMELCNRCPDTATKVQANLDRLVSTFEGVLARGQEAGEVTREHSAEALSQFLAGVIQGIVVMGKSKRPKQAIEQFAHVALGAVLT